MKRFLVIFILLFSLLFSQNNNKNVSQSFLPAIAGGVHYQFQNESIYWNVDFQYNLLYLLTEEKAFSLPYRSEIFIHSSLYRSITSPIISDFFFTYGLGLNISFLRSNSNLKKSQFFIPFMGITFGGIYDGLSAVSGLSLIPSLGINIFSFQKSFLNLTVSSLLSTVSFNRHLSVNSRLTLAISF